MRDTTRHVAWVLELAVREGRDTEFRALMTEMVDATHADEPGTLAYESSASADGRTVHVYERHADSASAMTHLGTFLARWAARFLDVYAPQRMTVYGAPDDAVRAALAALAPTYLAPAAGFHR